jgi:hypothetical protein
MVIVPKGYSFKRLFFQKFTVSKGHRFERSSIQKVTYLITAVGVVGVPRQIPEKPLAGIQLEGEVSLQAVSCLILVTFAH